MADVQQIHGKKKEFNRKRKSIGGKDGPEGRQLQPPDFVHILDWMESDRNWEKIEAVEKNTAVGIRPKTKMAGFRELAAYLNSKQVRGSNLQPLDGESMKSRWRYFFGKWKKVKQASQVTGWGVTDQDKKQGIFTIPQKLASQCEHFHRMNALFGSHPSVINECVYISMHGIKDAPVQSSSQAASPTVNGGESDVDESPALHRGGNVSEPQTPGPDGAQPFGSPVVNPISIDRENFEYEEGQPDTIGTRSRMPGPQPTEESTPVCDSIQQADGKVRAAKPSTYPSKKTILKSRHSMDSAFTASLEDMNAARAKANEINERRWLRDEELKRERFEEDKRIQTWTEARDIEVRNLEMARYAAKETFENEERQWARNNADLDRAERRAEREDREKARAHERDLARQRLIGTVISAGQNRSTEDIMKIIQEINRNSDV